MPKTILALALSVLAGLSPALAQSGCGHDRQAQMSCAPGQSWDAATGKCVPVGS